MFRSSLLAVRLLSCLLLGAPAAQAGLKTLVGPQGGTIVYGRVESAASQAAAMGYVLRSVHDQCGERPKVGKPFQVRGTRSVAVFFTVTRRAQGDGKAVAGLVIAADGAPGQVEAALVTHDAARFGATVNPMLNQLFEVWHPGGEAGPAGQAGATGRPAAAGRAASMRRVALRDQSGSVGVPEGWRLDPQSGGGSAKITGPQGQMIYFNQTRLAMDPTDPGTRRLAQSGIRPQTAGKIVHPFNGNAVQAFPDLFHQYYRLNGLSLNAGNCRFDRVEPVPTPRGQTCVHATGHVDPDGKGMREMNVVLSTGGYQAGSYLVVIYISLCPNALADRERATMEAAFGSFQVNQAVVNQQANAIAAPGLARIKAIGDAAKARFDANNAANDRQHAAWNADQDNKARGQAGFHNYLLDQTVIQDNKNNAHGTVWNSTADALVRTNPERFELVQTPNFWKGIDY